mmetsp:Transcript_2689/g.3097  ORF Transcript_2689/g.3097 Transcript_2689/m.3097 type:complete len:112 (-) Transcript_2689:1642-1977(-)
MIVVRVFAFIRLSRAACTMRSLSLSSADVASSSIKMVGSLITARAIAIRCFCPPLSWMPLSPTCVSYFSGNPSTNMWAFAALAAAITSWSVAPDFPCRMLSMIDAANRTGS